MEQGRTSRSRLRARRAGWSLSALALLIGAFALHGYRSARADPIVRRLVVRLPGWPAGGRPVRVALLSDIHVGSPATDAARLARIVATVNGLRPDLVLLAGDFVAGHDPSRAADFARRLTAPLSRLRAPLGVVAVLGNHDHSVGASVVRQALVAAGVTVLANRAERRGPLDVIGVDDGFSGHADVGAALAAAAPLGGARVLLTHTPDTAATLPRGATALVLAGHTHCGQTVLPLIGPVVVNSPRLHRRLYDPRFRCGAVRDGDRLVVVTGGIGGTVPFRFRAPPDLWLLTLGP